MRRLDHIASPLVRRKVLRKVGREVLKNSRKRTRQQTDIKGRSFKQHAKGRKRKMLTRLARAKNLNIISLSGDHVLVGFKNPVHQQIAAKQQYGHTEHLSAEKMAKRQGDNKNRLKPATRKQGKALIAEGFKKKRASGGYQTPSIKWITENMNRGRAGLILRALRGGAVSEWDTVLPKRAFFGISDNEKPDIIKQALEMINEELQGA